ncbi:sensor domain-containing protein [Neobacillus sp. LXY-4]|uniref:sensor domain-containing protein n=1 Tax=Neobacillus sp. LXY-4 TaxID=3379826 RepID=UPI003EE1BEA3
MNEKENVHTEELKQLRSQIIELERENLKLSKQIRVNHSLYLSVLDALPINIFLEDPEGHTIFANKQACQSNGKSLKDLMGKTVYDFFPPAIAEINRAYDLEVWRQRKLITKEILAGFQGKEHHMFTGKTIIHINESNEDYLLGFGLDISDRVRAEELLRESEEKFRSVIEQAADSFFLIEKDGAFIDVNPTACEVLGFSKDELLTLKTETVFSSLPEKLRQYNDTKEDSSTNFEDIMIAKDSIRIPVDINIRPIKIGVKQMFFALCRDIRDKKRVEAQMRHMAYHDALTDLPNRWYIQSYLQYYIANIDSRDPILGIILLDLDNFKVINDSLGHDAGDLLLKEVSIRVQAATEDRKAIVARFGGDEFICLVPHLTNEEEISSVCEKISQTMHKPFYIYGQKFNISASSGISFYPKDGKDLNTLIKNADIAMYDSKEQGRSCYSLYNPDMKKYAMERMDLEIQLREALEENEFILHYQPKINLLTGQLYGVEALLRWRNKQNEILMPNTFIRIAEETGLIIPIGEWAIREVCRQCKEWHDAGFDHLSVSVNLSPKQFQKNNLEALVISVLEESSLPPHSLELELTEGMLMKNPEEAVVVLKKLKQLGIKISIDDFGTGFSSLSYLKLFPINTLKIDKSFITNLELDEANATIASAVISLAHSLNLEVVAEGIENKEQYDFLLKRFCDFGQGYHISEPLSPEEFYQLLTDKTTVKI